MWDLPRPGLEPVSPALAGKLSTTAPPEKRPSYFLYIRVELLSFTCGYPVFPIPFVEENILSPLSGPGTLVKGYLNTYTRIYF